MTEQQSKVLDDDQQTPSIIDNAIKGTQAAANYLLSFISSPPTATTEPSVQPKQQVEICKNKEEQHLVEDQILTNWKRKHSATALEDSSKFTLSEYKNLLNVKGQVSEKRILNDKQLSIVQSILIY